MNASQRDWFDRKCQAVNRAYSIAKLNYAQAIVDVQETKGVVDGCVSDPDVIIDDYENMLKTREYWLRQRADFRDWIAHCSKEGWMLPDWFPQC